MLRSLFVASLTITFSVTYAQSSEGFRGANRIIVVVDNANTDSVYYIVGKLLVANDVPVEISNKEFYQFRTGPKAAGEYYDDLSYTMTLAIENNTITIAPIVTTYENHILHSYGWYWTRNWLNYRDKVLDDIVKIFSPLGRIMFDRR